MELEEWTNRNQELDEQRRAEKRAVEAQKNKKQKVFYNNLLNTKSQVEPLTKSLTLEFGFIITYYFLVRSTSTACCENISSSVTVMNTCDSRFKLQLTLEVRPRPTI